MLGIKRRKQRVEEAKSGGLETETKLKKKGKEEKKASLAALGLLLATVVLGLVFWGWGVISETSVRVEREERVGGGVVEDGVIIFEK